MRKMTIPGHPLYSATEDGRVYSSNKFKEEREIHGWTDSRGRKSVEIDGKHYFKHQLVMLAFVGEPPDGQVVCHNNGNHADNRLSNLRYDTQAANIADTRRHGNLAWGERSGSAKLTNDEVLKIRDMIGTKSLRAIGRQYGVSHKTVAKIRDRKSWPHI